MLNATSLPVLLSNRPSSKYEKIKQFLQALRTEKGIAKIAGVGYCYGGGLALEFATTGDLAAAVMCHPSLINMAQVKKVKTPTSWALAEVDQMVSEKFAQEIRQYLTTERKDLDFEMKTYPGTVHGSFARPNLGVPEVKEGFEGAFKQTVEFVRKHLQVPSA